MNGVTIRTIASEIGVSVSTVSRALDGSGRVGEATRARVIEAANRLGYQRNEAARALVSGKTRTVGVVIPDITNPYFAMIFKGAQARARDQGYVLLMGDSGEDAITESDIVDDLLGKASAVLMALVSSANIEERIARYSSRVPLVLLDQRHEGISSVGTDMRDGIRQAMLHLHALGHQKVSFLQGATFLWPVKQRANHAQVFADELGMELIVTEPHSPTPDGGAAALAMILASGATAVLAYNDLMAFGLLAELKRSGLRCPDDLSVVGMDNVPFSELFNPPLSTLGVPLRKMGRASIDLLVRTIERPGTVEDFVFGSEFVLRHSTGTPRFPS